MVSDLQDLTDGSSKLYSYNPSFGISQTEETYSGSDASGDPVSKVSNYTSGTSEITAYNPSSDVSETSAYFSGPDESGRLYSIETNYSSGQLESVYYPSSGNISQEVIGSTNGVPDNVTINYNNGQSSITTGYDFGIPETTVYTGPDGTGISTGTTGPGGPEIDLGGAGGSGGYDVGGNGAEGASGAGSLGEVGLPSFLDAVVSNGYSNVGIINAGVGDGTGSVLDNNNPPSDVAEIVTRYSSPGRTGALLSTLTDYTNGTSQFIKYNPSNNVIQIVASYSGPDGTGTLLSKLTDFTNGRSSVTIGYGPGRGGVA